MSRVSRIVMRTISVLGIILFISVLVLAWRRGIFSSQKAMTDFVIGLGIWGPLVFTLIQIIQVIIPIIPGGISCLAGVLMFGPVKGFILNYIGISLGSLFIFMLARICGRPLLERFFRPSMIERYDGWTKEDGRFGKLFAIAIFFPLAPDDFLCALAGTTRMRLGFFIMVIILGKPMSIFLYSLFLQFGWKLLIPGV